MTGVFKLISVWSVILLSCASNDSTKGDMNKDSNVSDFLAYFPDCSSDSLELDLHYLQGNSILDLAEIPDETIMKIVGNSTFMVKKLPEMEYEIPFTRHFAVCKLSNNEKYATVIVASLPKNPPDGPNTLYRILTIRPEKPYIITDSIIASELGLSMKKNIVEGFIYKSNDSLTIKLVKSRLEVIPLKPRPKSPTVIDTSIIYINSMGEATHR